MSKSEWRRRWRKANAGRLCLRCCSEPPMPGSRRCAWCRAKDAERKPWLAHLRHDTAEHALMVADAHAPGSACEASGLRLEELVPFGLRLEVDRIDSRRGYVRGNMQLLASRLNRAKQACGDRLPDHEARELARLVRADHGLEARTMGAFDSGGGGW